MNKRTLCCLTALSLVFGLFGDLSLGVAEQASGEKNAGQEPTAICGPEAEKKAQAIIKDAEKKAAAIIKKAEAKRKTLTKEGDFAEARGAKLRKELDELSTRHSSLKQEVKKLAADYEAQTKKFQTVKEKNQNLEKELRQLEAKQAEVLKASRIAETNLGEIAKVVRDLEHQKTAAQSDLALAEQNLAEITKAIAGEKDRQKKFSQEVSAEKKRLAALEEKVEKRDTVWMAKELGASMRDTVAELVERLSNPKARTKQEAADMLVQAGNAAIPQLVEALQGADRELRGQIVDILKRMDTPDARVALNAYSTGKTKKEELKDKVDVYIENLTHPDWNVRAYAEWALREIDSPKARDALRRHRKSQL